MERHRRWGARVVGSFGTGKETRHAEGQLFGSGALECAPSEEVLAELVEDAPSLAPMAEDDVADFDDVQDDEEGEFDEAAAMGEERNLLQDFAHSRISKRPGSSTVRDRVRQTASS